MTINNDIEFLFKPSTLAGACFPQLPSFCGIASCIGVINAMLNTAVTQQELHERYGIGAFTKLPLKTDSPLENLALLSRTGSGFSNWDLIRLVNAVCLDAGKTPYSAILCGQDFVREIGSRGLADLIKWLSKDCNQVIIHIKNHYLVLSGVYKNRITNDYYFIMANSSKTHGPCSSMGLNDLLSLAKIDPRYGMVFFSLENIPQALFNLWTPEMLPIESRNLTRFDKMDH
jgi:hypothetical protein